MPTDTYLGNKTLQEIEDEKKRNRGATGSWESTPTITPNITQPNNNPIPSVQSQSIANEPAVPEEDYDKHMKDLMSKLNTAINNMPKQKQLDIVKLKEQYNKTGDASYLKEALTSIFNALGMYGAAKQGADLSKFKPASTDYSEERKEAGRELEREANLQEKQNKADYMRAREQQLMRIDAIKNKINQQIRDRNSEAIRQNKQALKDLELKKKQELTNNKDKAKLRKQFGIARSILTQAAVESDDDKRKKLIDNAFMTLAKAGVDPDELAKTFYTKEELNAVERKLNDFLPGTLFTPSTELREPEDIQNQLSNLNQEGTRVNSESSSLSVNTNALDKLPENIRSQVQSKIEFIQSNPDDPKAQQYKALLIQKHYINP